MMTYKETAMRLSAFIAILLTAGMPAAALQQSDSTDPLPLPQAIEIREAPEVTALRQVEAYMENTQSMKAHFKQQNADGTIARGTLYMQRPGRVRFDYDDDTPFLIVSDGKTLNLVDNEVGQVTRWPVKDTPLRLLLGDRLDLSGFHSSILPGYAGYEDLIAVRAKDKKRPELGEITLVFRPNQALSGALELYRWAVVDSQGQVTVVEVSDMERNPELASALWTFEDPRGLAKRRRIRR